jgi:hypothetical protein
VQNDPNGDASFPASHVAIIENTSPGNNADVLALKVGINPPTSGNNFITFFAGAAAVGCIEGSNVGLSVTYATSGADFAECLPRSSPEETLQPGDIVGVHEGQISRNTANAHHAMVITNRPAVVGNNPSDGTEHLYSRVAFVGQVDIRVRGSVRAGDVIVPSGDNDGVGVARSPEAWRNDPHRSPMVGTAWASSDDNDVKLIRAVVGIPTHL